MIVRTSDLRMREVVNTSDGRRMGFITDVDVDLESGRVKSFVIPGTRRFLALFGKNDDVVIPFARIKKIGVDFILVDMESYADGIMME